MISNIRFSGIHIFQGITQQNMKQHLDPVLKGKNASVTVINQNEEAGWLNVVVMYGKELYLYAHEKWGVELAPITPKEEAQANVNAMISPLNQDPEKMEAFKQDVVGFVSQIEERDPDSVTYVDLTA